MRKKVFFKGLELAGYGVRNTVKSKIKKGKFPPPDGIDETDHPFWWEETIEMHEQKLSESAYTPVTPEALIKHPPPKKKAKSGVSATRRHVQDRLATA